MHFYVDISLIKFSNVVQVSWGCLFVVVVVFWCAFVFVFVFCGFWVVVVFFLGGRGHSRVTDNADS